MLTWHTKQSDKSTGNITVFTSLNISATKPKFPLFFRFSHCIVCLFSFCSCNCCCFTILLTCLCLQGDEQPNIESIPHLWPLWEPLPLFPGWVSPTAQVNTQTQWLYSTHEHEHNIYLYMKMWRGVCIYTLIYAFCLFLLVVLLCDDIKQDFKKMFL